MSRRDRRARTPRRRTRPTLSEARRPLRLAVATTPKWRAGRPSLADDLEIVKAGILYADDVELVGLAASLVHKVSLADESKQLSLERFLRITQLVTGEDASPPPGLSWADLRSAEKIVRLGGAMTGSDSNGRRSTGCAAAAERICAPVKKRC